MKTKRDKIIPAAYAALIRNRKILLLKRKNTGFADGMYSMVAGHVEHGESFTQCIIREAREEAGITLRPEDLKAAHVMHGKAAGEPFDRLDVFFLVENWGGEIVNREPDKCDDLSWFPPDTLPENTIPFIRQAIDAIAGGVFYSEYGW